MTAYQVTLNFAVEAKSEKAVSKLIDKVEALLEREARLVTDDDGSTFSASWKEATQ